MKLAVLMDPIDTIKAYKDTSVAMLKSAQSMGWKTHFFGLNDLYCRDGQALARVSGIKVLDDQSKDWAEVSEAFEVPLSEFDIILMRKDPPFDLEYIYATYALELAEKQGVFVANKPQSLRDANEKFFTLQFPQCCPETLVSRDKQRLKDFWKKHQNVIFKPLEGMGGSAVFHVDKQGLNLSVILEQLSLNGQKQVMAQTYIPEIKSTGDKRILMVHGKPVPYALARIPEAGELRGNLAAGAKGVVVEMTDRDRWICDQLSETLLTKGLYFVGIDVIGDYLTEINVTSPTCLKEISQASGLDIAGDFLRELSAVAKARLPERFK